MYNWHITLIIVSCVFNEKSGLGIVVCLSTRENTRWIAKVCSDGGVAHTILPLRPHRRCPRPLIQKVCSLSCYQPWEHSKGSDTDSINRVNLSIYVTTEKFLSMNTFTFKEIHVKIIDRKCYICIVNFRTAPSTR